MSYSRRAALVAVLLAAAYAPLAPASAEPCLGTASTAEVCLNPGNANVDPTGGPGVHLCPIVGDPANCVHVDVPTPSVGTSGPLYTFGCTVCGGTGPLVQEAEDRAQDALDKAQPTVDRVDDLLDILTRLQCAPSRSAAAIPPPPPPDNQVIDNIEAFIASCV